MSVMNPERAEARNETNFVTFCAYRLVPLRGPEGAAGAGVSVQGESGRVER
jgi:hypothetical protein